MIEATLALSRSLLKDFEMTGNALIEASSGNIGIYRGINPYSVWSKLFEVALKPPKGKSRQVGI
jgi:hypothetical protein